MDVRPGDGAGGRRRAGRAGPATKSPPSTALLEINTPPTRDASVAISPDGLKVVFAAACRRPVSVVAALAGFPGARVRCPGPSAASRPFWSPDSRSIGFVADTRLKRVDIDGGSVHDTGLRHSGRLSGAHGTMPARSSSATIRAGRFSASPPRVARLIDQSPESNAATARTPVPAVPPRRPALPLLRQRQPGGTRGLCRTA